MMYSSHMSYEVVMWAMHVVNFVFLCSLIAAPDNKTARQKEHYAAKPSFSIRTVKVWRPDSVDAPIFDEDNYEVAKYAVFRV